MDNNSLTTINQCHLFRGATHENLELLASILRVRKFPKGEVIFADGDEADGFYIVGQGKVKIYKLSPEGKERILHVIQPGNSFAEAAIFDDGCYPAFAETLVSTELLFFPKREFFELLHLHTHLAINMIAGLSRFLRLFTVQIEDLTFRDVPARLSRYLLDINFEEGGVVVLPITKSQLASNLGTTSETLSRTFRKLADDEIIAVKGKQITLLDFDRLYALAESFKES